MKLKQYTIADFKKLVFEEEFLHGKVIPVTPVRIKSQINNPKALDSDVVLTVAIDENDEILGYAGALPDEVNGLRCAWNSCWRVKNGAPAEVSMQLLFTFISNWNKNVMFSEMTPHTSRIIEALGFCKPVTNYGLRGYFRSCLAEILPRKRKSLSKIKGILKLIDVIANLPINLYSILYRNSTSIKTEIIAADKLTDEDEAFIQKHNSTQPSKRNIADFQWIDRFSWLVDDKDASTEIANKYYFSYKVSRFRSQWVRFMENEQLVGLVNFTIRDKELKLPYIYCEEGTETIIGDFFYTMLVKDKKLASVTTFHPAITSTLLLRKHFLFKTRLPKYSAISKDLYNASGLTDISFQMGDGDCVFT